jgi:hypothetical protein
MFFHSIDMLITLILEKPAGFPCRISWFMLNIFPCRKPAVFYRITYKTHLFSVIFVSGKYNDL